MIDNGRFGYGFQVTPWTVIQNILFIMASFERKRMNIYVGNIAYNLSEDELRSAFEEFGTVESARFITDRETGRSKGFGFVEMPNKDEATQAIDALNGKDLQGRALTVNEARPREERSPRSGGGNFGKRY